MMFYKKKNNFKIWIFFSFCTSYKCTAIFDSFGSILGFDIQVVESDGAVPIITTHQHGVGTDHGPRLTT